MTLLKIAQYGVVLWVKGWAFCASSDHTCAILINEFKNAGVLEPFCFCVQCQTDL